MKPCLSEVQEGNLRLGKVNSMFSINKQVIAGYLGRDPEVRTTQSGGQIVTFSVATTETWKDKSGSKQERTEWHNVVCFNEGLVGIIERYTHKGSYVYLEGTTQTRRSTDKSGVERVVKEVVLGPNSVFKLGDSKPAPPGKTTAEAVPEDFDAIPF